MKFIQIRGVSDEFHAALKAASAMNRMSMTAYIIKVLKAAVRKEVEFEEEK